MFDVEVGIEQGAAVAIVGAVVPVAVVVVVVAAVVAVALTTNPRRFD